jgi:class 3 adenylate cyclase
LSVLRPRTFRARLFRDLLVLVGGFFVVTLVVIGVLALRQVRQVVRDVSDHSQHAFRQQERQQQDVLISLGRRLGQGARLTAALDETLQSGDRNNLSLTLQYELGLGNADSALAAVTGPGGEPLVAWVNARAVKDPASAVPARLVARMLNGDTTSLGYHVLAGRLYSVHVVPLFLDQTFEGTLTLGLPVDDRVAQNLGEVVGVQVCFVAGHRCVAKTTDLLQPAAEQMAGMAGLRTGERVTWGGKAYSLVSNTVSVDSATPVWWVIAVPLDDELKPFRSLAIVSLTTGLLALLGALGVGAALSNRLTRPVQALSAATARVREGDFSARVPVEGDDELGALSDAFNQMTHDLMLKDRYQAALVKTNSPEIAAELVKGTDIAPGGENRDVTILYADIRGFTPLTEGMEPQEVIAIVNAFLERASEVVSAEGGLVDKFLGDQIMALFGAPMTRGGDAARAVRAGLRIQQAVDELSAGRVARGEPAIRVGVGINSGTAVAGFVGSPTRLNYTVLGESVNVAARLCSVAGPGESLLSEPTRRRLSSDFEVEPAGQRQLKGLSQPVEVFRVLGFREPVETSSPSPAAPSADGTSADASAEPAGARPAASTVGVVATALLLALGCAIARPAAAQDMPTLQEMGVRYTSPGGWLQVAPSGRLEATGYVPAEYPSWLVPTTRAFVAPRLSLFADVFLGSHVYAFAEARADRGEEPAPRAVQARLEQAFVRWTPLAGRDLGLQAGKFATPFGAYAQRHHTAADPFIRPPLPYEYRTVICAGIAPGSARGFLTWRDLPDVFRGIGSPVVWGVPYQAGVMALGSLHGVSGRVALMNSAPSSPPPSWNPDFGARQHPSLVAAVGVQVAPELRVGMSYDRGPYLRANVTGPVPGGVGAYGQDIWGFDASMARGPVQMHAEAFIDRWEVPNVEDYPRDYSYYLESRVQMGARTYAAARYAAIRFSEISNGSPTAASLQPWDYDAERVELAGGFRTGRNTELRAEYAFNLGGQPRVGSSNLLSVQWAYDF